MMTGAFSRNFGKLFLSSSWYITDNLSLYVNKVAYINTILQLRVVYETESTTFQQHMENYYYRNKGEVNMQACMHGWKIHKYSIPCNSRRIP